MVRRDKELNKKFVGIRVPWPLSLARLAPRLTKLHFDGERMLFSCNLMFAHSDWTRCLTVCCSLLSTVGNFFSVFWRSVVHFASVGLLLVSGVKTRPVFFLSHRLFHCFSNKTSPCQSNVFSFLSFVYTGLFHSFSIIPFFWLYLFSVASFRPLRSACRPRVSGEDGILVKVHDGCGSSNQHISLARTSHRREVVVPQTKTKSNMGKKWERMSLQTVNREVRESVREWMLRGHGPVF